MNIIIKSKQYKGLSFNEIIKQSKLIQKIGYEQWRKSIEKDKVGIYSENAKQLTFTIPQTIEIIESQAFYGCVFMNHINFSNVIKSTWKWMFCFLF